MDLRQLALSVHLFGFAMWVGALVAIAWTLAARSAHEGDAGRSIATLLAKSAARSADVGAGLAILGGLWVLSFAPGFYMHQPWMHAKLTLVVVLLGLHGVVRARVGRASRGNEAAFPAWVLPVLVAVAATIVVLVVFKPWAKMLAP